MGLLRSSKIALEEVIKNSLRGLSLPFMRATGILKCLVPSCFMNF